MIFNLSDDEVWAFHVNDMNELGKLMENPELNIPSYEISQAESFGRDVQGIPKKVSFNPQMPIMFFLHFNLAPGSPFFVHGVNRTNIINVFGPAIVDINMEIVILVMLISVLA